MFEQVAVILQKYQPTDLPLLFLKIYRLIYLLIPHIRYHYLSGRFPPVPHYQISIHLIYRNKFTVIGYITDPI